MIVAQNVEKYFLRFLCAGKCTKIMVNKIEKNSKLPIEWTIKHGEGLREELKKTVCRHKTIGLSFNESSDKGGTQWITGHRRRRKVGYQLKAGIEN